MFLNDEKNSGLFEFAKKIAIKKQRVTILLSLAFKCCKKFLVLNKNNDESARTAAFFFFYFIIKA